ncbi:Trk system potassium transporter TrkA [Aminicella lysinilytica]|uniref:Trk system potassium uptake protein TrkA n=1 Tax=Aminicella lysinilytica TaxID=433323 RepID=A0A4R6Q5X5_9FIRM|nr:Trk system potassium transporter TrkA [Aminicella lysinilytica]TDP57477.1 trk system potassium uptake protein TrkA [Aminicella lysinilytica]
MNVAIVGAGKLGFKVAEALIGGDYSITIIDKNDAILQKLSQQLDVMTINDDARQISVLKRINISSFEYLLAVTGNDETNIIIASFAKKLGCDHVIARVREPEHMSQFDFIKESMGIDSIVNPDMAITVEIYKYLAEKYTLSNGIFTSGRIALTEFPTRRFPALVGLSIPDVREVLPDMLIAALSRNGKVIIPHGEDEIMDGDFLYVLGEKNRIMELNKQTHEKGKYTNLHKVMIVGGGKTGFYLAAKLSEFGAAVKLVEKNMERCRYLSTHLNNVMVLHSDGTDIPLLEEENMDEMDAFVTCTGYDEENLLLALTAKQHNIPDVISKVSHENYRELIRKMGVDMVLNPLDITASNILRYIQGSKKIISSVLIQGQAEIMEIIANSRMTMIGVPISKLELPSDILIAAIHRGNEVIIPDGNTTIQLNDRVIILNLLSGIGDIEKLLKPKAN